MRPKPRPKPIPMSIGIDVKEPIKLVNEKIAYSMHNLGDTVHIICRRLFGDPEWRSHG